MGFLGWLFTGKDLYLNYEKSFERIVKKSNAILARRYARRQKMQTYSRVLWNAFTFSVVAGIGHLVWLNRMPAGALPVQQHITRSALSVIVPLATFILHSAFGKIVSLFESRDNSMLKRLYDSKKKMVQDLKDSTRFEKTMALIRKYSPEDQASLAPSPQPVPIPITPATKQRQQNQPIPTPPSHLLSAAAGAGKVLFPMFDSLATNMIGDNPQLVAHLRQTQAQLAAEQQRNAALMQQINELQAKYGISSADMSATRQLNAQHEPQSPPKSLTFDVQAEEETNASPSFLTGPFIQPKTLTYSGGEGGTPESRLQQSVEQANGSMAHGGADQPKAKEEGPENGTTEGKVPERGAAAQQKPDARKSKIPSVMGTSSNQRAAEGQSASQSKGPNGIEMDQRKAGK
ncbi:hypothetical protein DUNSADRAFT_8374 [Dunaliella salina]|uniref:Uncharacterized protein n=1 Tax=Dunaliella salina TaxID=3046 RepID=A0ABQ7GJR1_DUNSA|nr:hypothetical protein DUNSADRAFT_8374 [Dunaliella salina]|eukprot:KAF5834834.1 hypothetical protein DUNSADRAFT_8374 [Dunaliella salina]